MDWKFFRPNPMWAGTRSYVLESDGRIIGHACISPVTFSGSKTLVSSAQLIDWAAGPQMPAAGLMLMRQCLPLTDSLLAIGGSQDARPLFPRMNWLRRLAGMTQYARPLRPLRQILRSKLDWKTPARLARNVLWNAQGLPASKAWSAARVSQFAEVWQPRADVPVLLRTKEWMNYLLDCPAASMEAYLVLHDKQPRGHFLLARVGPQTRIVDLVVDTEDHQDWVDAIASAVRQAALQPDACEVAAASSLPLFCRALEACGFHERGRVPVYIADPKNKIADAALVEITLAVGDGFYFSSPEWPFWT